MITSLNNKTIKSLMKLKQKKYRDETNSFLVDGAHMVKEALAAKRAKQVITSDEKFSCDVETLYVSDAIMQKLSFTKTPQPYMALCQKEETAGKDEKRILIFDGVQDPGNVGTMIRSALAFGFDRVIFSPDSADLYNDKTLRSTQGALFQMRFSRADLKNVIPSLKTQGFQVIGSSLHQAHTIDDISTGDKMAFVMGNEGQGMKEETLSLCDENLYIPIKTMESLNVGVAAGIIMYTFRR